MEWPSFICKQNKELMLELSLSTPDLGDLIKNVSVSIEATLSDNIIHMFFRLTQGPPLGTETRIRQIL